MLNPGAELQNRYKIERQVGAGGMGTVYIGIDQRFGTKVAIKETHFTDAGMRRAFEQEAQLLNGLRHPALPRVSDHFCENDGQFIVMEYIAGKDLSEIVEGGFAVSDVLRWADTLLDALDYLHTQKTPILHRDIKPQNLKLTARGEVVLLDFGLAKGSISEQTQAANLQSVYGYSLSYAPLEQIQGIGTDSRTDIYSLAATIYHLLTGQPPADCITRATAIVKGNVDPLEPAYVSNDKIPVSISKVLHKALALNPNLRPTSAAEMRRELNEAAAQFSPSEKFSNNFANEETIAINYGSIKSKTIKASGIGAVKNLKADLLKIETANRRKTETKSSNFQTDYKTKTRTSEKSFGSKTAFRSLKTERESLNKGFIYKFQNSRALQFGALVTFLVFGCGIGSAWYSMSQSNISVKQNPQTISRSDKVQPESAEAATFDNLAETEKSLPVYTSTPIAAGQTTMTYSDAETTQAPQAVFPQAQASPAVEETTQTAAINNTNVTEAKAEEPSRPQQETTRNNYGNQFDEEKMKAEMKRQVDEALRQREELMNQQRNEQPQSQPYQPPPPPDGRIFPPPPGRRPPPPRRP